MAGTKRSASPAQVASKRKATSGQGLITEAFGGKKKASGSGASKQLKGKATKHQARNLTPDASDEESASKVPEPRTPDGPSDPTAAYPTPTKTPAKVAKDAALKIAVQDVGVVQIDEDDEPELQVVVEKQAPGKKAKVVVAKKATEAKQEPDRLKVKDKRWDKAYWDAREKMGGMDPIHGDGQDRIDQILRVFDMSEEYGPCVGMTRLQRWDRAQMLSLEPPEDVRSILLTQEGLDDPRYRESCFYQFSELRSIDV